MAATAGQESHTQGDSGTQQTRGDAGGGTFWSRNLKALDDCTLGTFSLSAIIIFGVIAVSLGINIFVEGKLFVLGCLLFLIGVMLIAGASYLCCKSSDGDKLLPPHRPQHRGGMAMQGRAGQPANTSNLEPPDDHSATHPLVLASIRPPSASPHHHQATPVIVPGQPGYTILVPDPGRPGSYLLIPPGQDQLRGQSTAPPLAGREDDLPPAYEDVVKSAPIS